MDLKLLLLVLYFSNKLFAEDIETEKNMKAEHIWSQIEFDFGSEEERDECIKNGTFIEGVAQPIDVQAYYNSPNKSDRRIFITCPRISDGIPASLGTITDKYRIINPRIAPYPNWDWHTDPETCKEFRMVSVYRVYVDSCNRLWVLDNGRIGNNQVCDPQILAFDLKTDTLLRKYSIPFSQHTNSAAYLTPVVEVESCEDTYVYNADSRGFSLLVYDFRRNKSWKIVDKTFYPYPDYGSYSIAGVSFELMDGLIGLALSPPGPNRKLFYHAMSSDKENWVYTHYLKNESMFSSSFGNPEIFHTYSQGRNAQSIAEAMDSSGNLYFSLLGKAEIASWNINYPYNISNFNIVGFNKKTMQFPTGVKVSFNENGEEVLWILSTVYRSNGNDPTKFIILSKNITDLTNSRE